jgi:hypothetical protein
VLLGQLVLIPPGQRTCVAAVWRQRERTEREACLLFASLAADLEATGEDRSLVAMARQAARDEERHAARCRELVARFAGSEAPPLPARRLRVEAGGLTRGQRALFAGVALSCVTETLSTALLLELREAAIDAAVKGTVREILKDEVDHARVGWAQLAAAARRGSVAWLAPHVAEMLRWAIPSSGTPSGTPSGASLPAVPGGGTGEGPDLSGYGVLPRAKVREVVRNVWRDVLAPGLARFGVAPHPDPLPAGRREGDSYPLTRAGGPGELGDGPELVLGVDGAR